MFSRFLALFNIGMRAYKIQDVKREKRIGVTAKTFLELVTKGCQKLQMDPKNVTVVLEDDGTLVDSNSFFQKLPTQTVLVFLQPGEHWGGAGALIHDALSKLYNTSKRNEIAEQIRDMLAGEGSPEKVHVISQYLEMLETDPEPEYRYEDEDWFEGLNKKYKTKQEVMRNSAQTRIRSYYNSAKEQIDKETDTDTKEILAETLDQMMNRLKKSDYHGSYFDRTARPGERMCDKKGWFHCEGPFDKQRIEKSREVIPTLVEAAKSKKKHQQIKWEYVYKLLFTRENLKLVQVGCHKKAARSQTCQKEDFLTS